MKKPELLVTPANVTEVEGLVDAGATAVMVGEEEYGIRLAGEFNRDDIENALKIAHQKGAKVYVAMNALFHNESLPKLPDYIQFLSKIGVDAIVFGDPAVLMSVREHAPELKLHWNTETTATNWYSANYWGRKGSTRAVLARELNMDSIVEIKEKAEVDIEVQVHGMSCMFQSKRLLLGNYMTFQGKDLQISGRGKNQNLILHDPERKAKYPIWEDKNGTHIMSPKDMCMIDELEELFEVGVDSFKIEGIQKDYSYMRQVTSLYREAIDLYFLHPDKYNGQKENLFTELKRIQPSNRVLDTGFFFKETVY
ncbi:collagenase-like protease [Salipaludibacillus neizhouensis]|uniref:Collagenase-like protease n=1 Tax=Salipaludibacillus neizhouensis TaxID=885475 RepID=A0A3A9KVF3_9BACI|nr:peptidase U32 family protein [Salipaludibacillus neizhouensis]RKL68596.1 collagenase-like protease [Salipaludibacillus neizhouensis]